jgi:hypothetical protein
MKQVILITIIALAGCASTPSKIITQTIPQAVPILYCPAPPVITRPILPSDSIVSSTSDGDVAKDYAASMQALLGYSVQLEDIVAQYTNIHNAYTALEAKVASDWKSKTGTELEISIPATPITPSANAPKQ